ncbi:MAG: transglutaminase family protein [Dehalococcoidia bacterium]
MATINPPLERPAARRISSAAIRAPRLVMSWEDWLTFAAAVITFLAVAVSLEQANWVKRMPDFPPTAIAGLLIGMVAARIRYHAAAIHPVALLLGAVVVVLATQTFADGVTLGERLSDYRFRMVEWYHVVRAGDISNDNLPFVVLVHALIFLSTYFAAWCLFRWRNAWLAVVPSGIILLTNISFLRGKPSEAFVVFLFGAIILIARLHLQKNQDEWKKDGIDYPEFISVSSIQLTVLATIGLIVGAWLIPLGNQAKAVESVFNTVAKPVTGQSDTFVRLFHNIDSRKGAQLHSFGDTLPIQGDVKLGTKQLFEVNSPDAGLIRATSYDDYTGAGWKVTGRETDRVDARTLAPDEEVAQSYTSRDVSILRVTVLDGESTLLTPGTPLIANVDTTIEHPKGFDGDIEEIRSRRGLNKNDTYVAIGSISKANAEQLNGSGTDYPEWVTDRYLQLPKSLPDRVGDETQRIVSEAGATTAYGTAEAIESFLREMPYDLTVPSPPPGRDATDYLLFDLKRGYFDYQSTAMCVMLRTQGVPCRLAVGYVLDSASGDETNYVIKKDNAYTWVEVFFPGYGWVNFNPTADRPAGGANGLGTTDLGNSGDPFEEPDLSGLFEDVPGVDVDPASPSGALSETPVVNEPFPWTLVFSIVGVFVVLAAVAFSGRLAWNWGLGGLDGRAKLWAKTHRLAGWAKLGSKPAETPREWSRRIGKSIDREDDAMLLSSAYEESKYGRPDLVRIDDEDAETSYRSLRGALTAKIFRRQPKSRTKK